MFHSPSQHNEHVQSVPGLRQIGFLAGQPHGNQFNDHFDGEEGEDEVVKALKNLAPGRVANGIRTRLIHAQGDAVEQDDGHADALEPRDRESRKCHFI